MQEVRSAVLKYQHFMSILTWISLNSQDLQSEFQLSERKPFGQADAWNAPVYGSSSQLISSCWPQDLQTGDKGPVQANFIFYGKPPMYALHLVATENSWSVRTILNDSISFLKLSDYAQSASYVIVWTTSRHFGHPVLQMLSNSSNALVSAVQDAYKVSGSKKNQLEFFQRVFKSHGCEMDLMPRSFLLDVPSDCMHFFEYAKSRPSSMWVLKTSRGFGGDGVSIFQDLSALRARFGACTHNKEYVAQEYLSSLLLLEGRKFDVRGLLLIAGTSPYMLFHHEGYLRVSVHRFNATGGREVHLTNSHVQSLSKGFVAEKHFWSFRQLQEYMDVHHPDNDNFVDNRLVPFIKKIGLLVVQAGSATFHRAKSTFQFIGIDVMVTQDYRTWFIETNNYPLWPRGTPFIDQLFNTLGVKKLVVIIFIVVRFVMTKAYRELSAEIGSDMKKTLQPDGERGMHTSHAGKWPSAIKTRTSSYRYSRVASVTGKDHILAGKLREAASNGSYEDVLELLRQGANAELADSKGRTALHFAACKPDVNTVKVLASYGSVNQRDCNGNTPLHLASCTHHVGVVTALLQAGTDVNALDINGTTPLHLALSTLKISATNNPNSDRKEELQQVVDMMREYLSVSRSTKDESVELEKLASQLSISQTPQEVDHVQNLLESFTSLSIQKRETR
eukprot:Em0020g316a